MCPRQRIRLTRNPSGVGLQTHKSNAQSLVLPWREGRAVMIQTVAHRAAQTFEATFAQLAHPLARYAVDHAEFFERHRRILQNRGDDDHAFAVGQFAEMGLCLLPEFVAVQPVGDLLFDVAIRVLQQIDDVIAIL